MARRTRSARPGVEPRIPDRHSEKLPPGSRSVQRDSRTQLEEDRHPARPDEPTAWERDLQDRLPPRGGGSQHNQGENKETATVEDEITEDRAPAATTVPHTGGTRGPSKAP
jgi:hypothetical protein